MGEEKIDCGEAAVPGNEEDSGEQTCDTLDGLSQAQAFAAYLEQLEIIHLAPGEYLYQEGDDVTHAFYVVKGEVEIKVAGNVVAKAEKGVPFGVEEFRYRKETPKYVQTAMAIAPASVAKLDSAGLRTLFSLQRDSAEACVRLVARMRMAFEKRLIHSEATVSQLRVALERTQDSLAERPSFPPRPSRVGPPPPPRRQEAPPYPDLRENLRAAREATRNVAKLVEERDKEFGNFLAEFRQILGQHPELAKSKVLEVWLRRMEQLAIKRANTVIKGL